MRMMYRLVFKDGTHGAWNEDYEFIKVNAEFFRCRIESKEFPTKEERER